MRDSIIYPFRNWWTFILGNLVMGFLVAILFFNFKNNLINISIGILWSAAISITQWLGHAYLQSQIEKKYSWLEKPLQRFIWTVVSIVCYSLFAFAAIQIIMSFIVMGQSPQETLKQISGNYLLPLVISFFVSILSGAIGFFVNWKKAVLKQEQLRSEMLNYKYEVLKNQINPHFMFNSLNVLSDLVYEDQKLAVQFIHQFSDIYRYVLEKRDVELVPLSEEIEFLEKFIFLLKTRFEEKLDVEIDLLTQSDELVVPLALQLLIENAVKHNEVSSQKPLIVSVVKQDQYISVSNTIQAKNIGETSKKIGLKNLEQQYQYFTDLPVKVIQTSDRFEVKIPILKKL